MNSLLGSTGRAFYNASFNRSLSHQRLAKAIVKNNNNSNNIIRNNIIDNRLTVSCFEIANQVRSLSSSPSSTFSLPRPPQFQRSGVRESQRETKHKWRTHAVSLEFGEYLDDAAADAKEVNAVLESQQSWEDGKMELARQVQDIQDETDERKKRWIENARPPVRKPIIDELGRSYGRGGRKTSSARVWIQPGFGNVVVNRQDFVDYFWRASDREHLLAPLAATGTCGKFDVMATVTGGGLTGQAGAIRHGLARALNHYNPDSYRPPLKRLGYLTRDPRKVERKKIGHLKARKKPQWVKR